jgi:hypothetical protein
MAIGPGFDSVNSEHNRRALSRILAQPIYRDDTAALKAKALVIAWPQTVALIGGTIVQFVDRPCRIPAPGGAGVMR